MGNSSWNPSASAAYQNTQTHAYQTASIHQTFKQRGMHPDLDPKNFKMRESRDSVANPNSTPIIVGLDQTGSMGHIPHTLVKGKLGTFMDELLKRKPVVDPHLMFMAIGDEVNGEEAPIQATQFEAGADEIVTQLEQLYLEGNGGGNGTEGYSLPWYLAATRTVTDSWEKRQKKGYLFTIGDESAPRSVSRRVIQQYFGDNVERDFTPKELLEMASKKWEVFHLQIERGNGSLTSWKNLMGERVLPVRDPELVAEVMISTMQVLEGMDTQKVVSSWSGNTGLVVADAVRGLTARGNNRGVVRL